MGIWDELGHEENLIETDNIYLKDPDKGFELLAQLLPRDQSQQEKGKVMEELNELMDHQLFESSEETILNNELSHYKRLQVLRSKLYEQNKLRLLQGKSVVGIGGKFSAGKSKFINAVIRARILPEDQTPTTSIATYLAYGDQEEIRAYTDQDQDILLDREAAKALTHAFHEKYGLGFSKFVSNLVVHVPTFPYQEIVLLDTPGYSKFDQGIKKSISDAEKAFQQLKTVDHLIWLVDIENGVIQHQDIEFINALNLKNPVLVVFNKADKKTKADLEDIITTSKEMLKDTEIKVYDVIGYSALNEKEYTGGDRLEAYLQEINGQEKAKETLEQEILGAMREILLELKVQKDLFFQQRKAIGGVIFRSLTIFELESLVTLYMTTNQGISEMNKAFFHVEKTKKRIKELLGKLHENQEEL